MQISDQEAENMLSYMEESSRLKTLSGEQLVKEYLRMDVDSDTEIYTNELCSRVWPNWDDGESMNLVRRIWVTLKIWWSEKA